MGSMGFVMRAVLLTWILGLICIASAAQADVPSCAQPCYQGAFSPETCTAGDLRCVCTNKGFQANFTTCISLECSIPDQLATKNVTLANCGVPLRNRGANYALLSNVFFSIACIFVGIRFGYKIFVSRADFGWDDWAILATVAVSIPSAIITVHGTVKYGLGQDLWALTSEQITKMLKYFYVMAVLYFSQTAFLKLSLIFFYLRVFPTAGAQRLLWGTAIFVILWGITFVTITIFQCRPINLFWTRWDGMHTGQCVKSSRFTIAHACISIVLDFWILGIPLFQLWGLKMNWKKKVGVAMMFTVGTFVTIVSILRLGAYVTFTTSANVSWDFYQVSVWSSVEICVGIMCSCLPAIRQVLTKLFPVLAGSSARSRANYYNCDDTKELSNMARSRASHKVRVATSNTSLAGAMSPEPKDIGIMIESSYTIKHSQTDLDDVSLVSHEGPQKR